jgi:hypothetical protein
VAFKIRKYRDVKRNLRCLIASAVGKWQFGWMGLLSECLCYLRLSDVNYGKSTFVTSQCLLAITISIR